MTLPQLHSFAIPTTDLCIYGNTVLIGCPDADAANRWIETLSGFALVRGPFPSQYTSTVYIVASGRR